MINKFMHIMYSPDVGGDPVGSSAFRLDKTWNEINAAYEAGKLIMVPASFNSERPIPAFDLLSIDNSTSTMGFLPQGYIVFGDGAAFVTLDPDDYPIDAESFAASLGGDGGGGD